MSSKENAAQSSKVDNVGGMRDMRFYVISHTAAYLLI